jgi:hypothetical protein
MSAVRFPRAESELGMDAMPNFCVGLSQFQTFMQKICRDDQRVPVSQGNAAHRNHRSWLRLVLRACYPACGMQFDGPGPFL